MLYDNLKNQQVYIRRLVDTRTADERAYTILVNGDRDTRPPVRDYIPQIDGSNWTDRVSTVLATKAEPEDDTVTARVQFRYSKRPAAEYAFSEDVYYRPADTVIEDNKHFTAVANHYGAFDAKHLTNPSYTWRDVLPRGLLQERRH